MSAGTLDNIKELRDIETKIYKDLHRQQSNDDMENKSKMLDKLKSVSKVRGSLVDNIRNDYESSQEKISQSRSDIDMISNAVSNKKRMVEINTYYGKQYDAHKGVAMLLIYTCVILSIIAFSRKRGILGEATTNFLVSVVMLIGAVKIIFRISDLSMRDSMDYDKYDWPRMFSDGKKAKKYIPPLPTPVGGESNDAEETQQPSEESETNIVDLTTCMGEQCCGLNTIYDSISNQCNVETFALMHYESPKGVSPFSKAHNCAKV